MTDEYPDFNSFNPRDDGGASGVRHILARYLSMMEALLARGEKVPRRTGEMFVEWFGKGRGAAAMEREISAALPAPRGAEEAVPPVEPCYTIERLSELYSVDGWTIRLWINRFCMRTKQCPHTGEAISLSSRDAATIGVISQMVGMDAGTLARMLEQVRSLEDKPFNARVRAKGQ